MSYFKSMFSHWSTYAGALGVLITFLTPSLNAYVAGHPKSVAGVLVAAVIAAYHAQAPNQPQPPVVQ